MLPNQAEGSGELTAGQTIILGEFDLRFQPEFCLPIRSVDMDMRAGFFTREKVKAEPAISKNSRTHANMLHPPSLDCPVVNRHCPPRPRAGRPLPVIYR